MGVALPFCSFKINGEPFMRHGLNSLNRLGAVYGALWGLLAGFPLGSVVDWGILLGVLGGIPTGILVTRMIGPRLVGGAWRIWTLAIPSLILGTVTLGVIHLLMHAIGTAATGAAFDHRAAILPVLYPYLSVLWGLPLPLALLNCWHLRRTLRVDKSMTGTVWPIKPADHT